MHYIFFVIYLLMDIHDVYTYWFLGYLSHYPNNTFPYCKILQTRKSNYHSYYTVTQLPTVLFTSLKLTSTPQPAQEHLRLVDTYLGQIKS